MKSNKKLIVVISIVLTLVVASGVFAYLFIMTDVFKSKEVLFTKYFTQNIETFQKITNLKTVETYENLKNENKYESNTNIKIVHSEGGEVSNPFNNLTAKLDIQKGDAEQYVYIDGQISYEDEEYLQAEIIKKQELYGIRFTDVVKQFVTVKKDENIEDIANDIGIDYTQMETLINILDGSEQIVTGEQISVSKDKYLQIISSTLLNGTFEKQKDAMITYNDVTTKTTAYSVELSSELVKNMVIGILNNVKDEKEILDKLSIAIDKEEFTKQIDETINWINEESEIPTVKVTVYEQKQQVIRTVLEVGVYKITIENIEQNEETKTKINYLNNNNGTELNLEIIKNNTESQENVEMILDVLEGNENYTITFSSQMQLLGNQIQLDAEISHKQDITTSSIILENKVGIGNDFEKIQSLESNNNITLNDMEEQKRKQLIDLLKQIVPQTTNERNDLLKQKLGLKNEETENNQPVDTENGEQISQVEINKFNSKFEFYTGDTVSAENVKTLLEIVKNHLATCEITEVEPQQDTESLNNIKTKVNIKLNIEKDVSNEDGANQVLEKINDNKKYKVLIFYKDANGLIDYITITEI